MNSVNLIGNLTFDPSDALQYTADGRARLRIQLAINSRKKDPVTGDWVDHAEFPYVTVWGNQAENVAKYLRKGSKVAVEGKINAGKYEDGNGESKYFMDISAIRVEFLSPKDGAGESTQEEIPF